MKGKVKYYNVRGGYGFIVQEDNSTLFVHRSEIKAKRLKRNAEVTYDVGTYNDKPVAVNVNIVKAEAVK